jgi:cyclic pyranopterin phosphate synthase
MTDEGGLSHVRRTPAGAEAGMVDVSNKSVTERSAVARATVRFPAGVRDRLRAGAGPKGPVEEMARAAGVLAAKRTGELIPLCHPLGLDYVEISFQDVGDDRLEIRCRTACHGRTGVEMEALTGVAVAALTVYDMAKALDKGIRIEVVELIEKRGGKSGTWRAADPGTAGAAG